MVSALKSTPTVQGAGLRVLLGLVQQPIGLWEKGSAS